MNNVTVWQFLLSHSSELIVKVQEQLNLVVISTGLSIAIGIPIGISTVRIPRIKHAVLAISALLWTIPSLALLAFLIPFLGIGIKPAIVALTIYALLPIIRNTITGMTEIPEASIQAAESLGFTRWQRLRLVELPLALPMIINGVRSATIICVGIATLAAFVGAGGLGDFINRGIAVNNTWLILLGAIPAAILALLFDFMIADFEKMLNTRKRSHEKKYRGIIGITLACVLFSTLALNMVDAFKSSSNNRTIIIASKNFTEQFILAELMAQLIEKKTNLHVIRKLNLGSTAICHAALIKGEIDMYPEYTGTAYLVVLKEPYQQTPPQQLYLKVKQAYLKKYQLIWLPPFGFNNNYALTVRKKLSQENQIFTISQLVSLASQLIIAAPTEFVVRPDGLPALQKYYHLQFKKIKALDPGLMYKAIANKEVDVIQAFTTDTRILTYHLYPLKDDKHIAPSYYAAPIIRATTLKAHPEIRQVLQALLGNINDKTMQDLNYQVDIKKHAVATVARTFLLAKKIFEVK